MQLPCSQEHKRALLKARQSADAHQLEQKQQQQPYNLWNPGPPLPPSRQCPPQCCCSMAHSRTTAAETADFLQQAKRSTMAEAQEPGHCWLKQRSKSDAGASSKLQQSALLCKSVRSRPTPSLVPWPSDFLSAPTLLRVSFIITLTYRKGM